MYGRHGQLQERATKDKQNMHTSANIHVTTHERRLLSDPIMGVAYGAACAGGEQRISAPGKCLCRCDPSDHVGCVVRYLLLMTRRDCEVNANQSTMNK